MLRIGLLALVMALVSGGIAFLVSRHELDTRGSSTDTSVAGLSPTRDRATTSLVQRSIRPVMTGQGQVISEDGRFLLSAPIASADMAYKLLATPPVTVKALIVGGPTGFDCAWAGVKQGEGGMAMRCQIPADILVVDGLSGTMVAATQAPVEGLCLPATAVVGSAGQGLVVVVGANGAYETRSVQLGAADSFWVQVTGGLDPTEQVLAYPIQSDLDLLAR
jgi:hypothetical protein